MSDLLLQTIIKIKKYTSDTGDTSSSLVGEYFIRFLVAGVFNTLFGFAVFCFFILGGLADWLALLVSTILGTMFNFLTFGSYVFRDLLPSRFPRFIIFYLFIYASNLALIEVLSIWINSKIIAQFFLMFPVAGLSYVLMSRYVFKKNDDFHRKR